MNLLKILLVFFVGTQFAQAGSSTKHFTYIPDNQKDTLPIVRLNEQAFKSRLLSPDKTILLADSALKLAQRIHFANGIAEAYRVKGIGKSYQNKKEEAFENYLNALTFFQESSNLQGEAKVYNNIGNLYREIDVNKSLENFNKSLNLATRLNDKELTANLRLNIGSLYFSKENYQQAKVNYQESLIMFTRLRDTTGIIQSLQNLGVVHFNIKQLDVSEKYLKKASVMAKAHNFFNSIARINLTLSSIYIARKEYSLAEKTISEGLHYSRLVKSPKLEYDYNITLYELENKRKNYQEALHYLQQVYRQDSTTYRSNISDKINLLEAQHRQMAKQKENELTIAKQRYTQVLIWGVSAVAILACVVILLLVKNVRKSASNNQELTRLNEEISKQKDDLDQVNHNLEAIIDQRTVDLKIKNQKLSEYSSHLSHQIRSPVATLKGLILLEEDKLIEHDELVMQMSKCINDLDDKIININENLNNPQRTGLTGVE